MVNNVEVNWKMFLIKLNYSTTLARLVIAVFYEASGLFLKSSIYLSQRY